MIVAINFANQKFKKAQKLNARQAKRFGADRVILYSPEDIPEWFYNANKEIFSHKRGCGYWLWKPFFVKKTLETLNENDYLIYSDCGSAFVNKISYLINAMENSGQNIMVFELPEVLTERKYTKRDLFIELNCDSSEFTETPQILASYFIIKKCPETVALIDEYLYFSQKNNLITDAPNRYGKSNYEDFIEHRHDQSIFSLLCKKNGIVPFRDPASPYYNVQNIKHSNIKFECFYPQVIELHRNTKAFSVFQLRYKKWYKYFDVYFYLYPIKRFFYKIIY